MKAETILEIVKLAAMIGGGLWIMRQLGDKLGKPGALNPASRDNVIYQTTGEVGFKIADIWKSDAEKKVDAMLKPPITPKKVIMPATKPAIVIDNSDFFNM